MKQLLLKIIYLFFCLNLGFSESVFSQTPPSVAPASGGVEPLNSLLGSVKAPTQGKYSEFQSICRENIYDTLADLPTDQQQKRIIFLEEKITKTLTSNKLKIRLLKEYIDQKKYSDAEKLYLKLKEEKLAEEEFKILDAVFLIPKKDFKKAQSLLLKILSENPKNIDALRYLAEIYKLDNNYFESATAYYDLNKITKISYDLELCEIHTLEAQYNEAAKECRNAARLNPNNPYPYIYYGISQREKLNLKDAARLFKASLKKQKTEMALTCLAELYFIKEKYKSSSLLFNKALETNANSARALLGLAWSQLKEKQYAESLETFKKSCLKDKKIKVEIRRAYKLLSDEKSPFSLKYAELAQSCNE